MTSVVEKGPRLEFLVAGYFQSQGFFVRRGIRLRLGHKGQDATDLDVYGIRFSLPMVSSDLICDCKDTRNAKGSERLFVTRGMADFIGLDRAYVALPVASPDLISYGKIGRVDVLSRELIIRAVDVLSHAGSNPCWGLADGAKYNDFEQKIKSIAKTDRAAREFFDFSRSLLLERNPYVALNTCIDLLTEAGDRLRLGPSLPPVLEQVWRYHVSDLISLLSVCLLRIASEAMNLDRRHRATQVIEGLTFGDIEPHRAQQLLALANELASEAVRASTGQANLGFTMGQMLPPRYADSVVGLIDRIIENASLYIDVPLMLDHLLFEHAFPTGKFNGQVFARHFPGKGEEHLKVARNILAFARDAANIDLTQLWGAHEPSMPRLNGEGAVKGVAADRVKA